MFHPVLTYLKYLNKHYSKIYDFPLYHNYYFILKVIKLLSMYYFKLSLEIYNNLLYISYKMKYIIYKLLYISIIYYIFKWAYIILIC